MLARMSGLLLALAAIGGAAATAAAGAAAPTACGSAAGRERAAQLGLTAHLLALGRAGGGAVLLSESPPIVAVPLGPAKGAAPDAQVTRIGEVQSAHAPCRARSGNRRLLT